LERAHGATARGRQLGRSRAAQCIARVNSARRGKSQDVTYRGYLRAMDMAMRARTYGAAIRFDPARAAWTLGAHEIRASETNGASVRFELYTLAGRETLVGSYAGTIGGTPQEVAQYLVYFLETGKPWHHGLAKKGLL
jgi:hypothetical protein